nr:TadE/TadG family type IV pilus assembly protein [uncultured Celeribacter sp.]
MVTNSFITRREQNETSFRPVPLQQILCRRRSAFWRGEDGSATIEFALWLPILAGLVMLATDATLLMHEQTYLSQVSRDAARMVAVGDKTVEEAQSFAVTRLGTDKTYTVSVVEDDDFVVASVSVPFSDVIIFSGPFSGSAELTGDVSMWIESSGENVGESS